jgi:hypothetical protein
LRLGRTGNALVLLGLVIFTGKEFAPALIFGSASWRDVLTANYAMSFPWTHHPEPARAVDALLVGVIALVWFLWVRTLAAERENRPILAWTMLGSAAIVAVVSFATRGIDPQAIYGLRYTQGWFGFGPFPNRNHTASFLLSPLSQQWQSCWRRSSRRNRAAASSLSAWGFRCFSRS